jgi:peptidoglycan/LPS O-acetylase OafA/YrhL
VVNPDNQQFIPRIESMRGIAALTVALMHVSVAFAYFPFAELPGRNFLDRVGLFVIHALSNGYGAVVAFFVISGFVLARSLDRKFDIPRFVIARVFRLYPAVIVTIAIFAAIYYAFGFSFYPKASFEPLNVLANMLILRADIDVVMWSLKAEVAATPLIIVCVWLFRRYGAWTVIAIAVALFGLAFVGQFTKSLGDDTDLAPIFAFPVGILVHFRGREVAAKLTPVAVTLCAIASVAIFCGCSFFKPTGTWTLLVQCLSAATLVMLIAYRTEAAIFKPLDLSVVRLYGRISYSLYLLHPLAIWTAAWWAVYAIKQFPAVPVTLIVVVAFVYSLAAITPLAWLSWRFVELPAMNRLRSAPAPRYGVAVAASSEQRAT